MTAYRYWREENGHLVAPLAGDVLALDGVALANPPPGPGDSFGVHYYTDKGEVLKVITMLPGMVVTAGEVKGPTYPDWRIPIYMAGGVPIVLPAGRRCSSYRVTAIYTDVPVIDYEVPVYPMKNLTCPS